MVRGDSEWFTCFMDVREVHKARGTNDMLNLMMEEILKLHLVDFLLFLQKFPMISTFFFFLKTFCTPLVLRLYLAYIFTYSKERYIVSRVLKRRVT